MNPFLSKLQEVIVNLSYGVLYACADDLGGALLRIASLMIFYEVFEIMHQATGMVLNTKKCVVVPLVPVESDFFGRYSV